MIKKHSTPKNEERIDRAFFTIIPNIIDDLPLSIYAVRIYVRIKRRAGENGICFENTKNLAKGCGMSTGSISKAKSELINAGLIKISNKSGSNGYYHEIRIIDVWNINNSSFSELKRSQGEGKRSSDETKNNPLIKSHEENIGVTAPLSSCENSSHDAILSNTSVVIKHPALEAIKKVTGFYPRKNLENLIIEQLGAYSGENGHRFRLMAASKGRNRTGKKIINQVADMDVDERRRLCDSPVNWRR